MIRLTSWEKWQGPTIKRVQRNREYKRSQGQSAPGQDAPFSMSNVAVCTSFGSAFLRFSDALGPKNGRASDGLLLRVLQYAGLHSALRGEIHVTANKFGPIVLSRPWDLVSVRRGKEVYAALLSSGVAVEIGSGLYPDAPLDSEGSCRVGSESPPSPQGGDPLASLSDPEPEGFERFVRTWTTRRGERKGLPHHDRARSNLRIFTDRTRATPGWFAKEFAWIKLNDPDGFQRVERALRRGGAA